MQYTKLAAPVALVLMVLAGCNPSSSDDDSSSLDDTTTRATIDATSTTSWSFFSFDSGTTVDESEDWDLAFSRYNVRSNADRVEMALAAPQDDFYQSNGNPSANVFTNATANSELEHILADYDVDALDFEADTLNAVIGRDGVNFFANIVPDVNSANDDYWWLLRSAEGDSFAKVNFTNVTYNFSSGEHSTTIAADFFVQGSSDGSFSGAPVQWSETIPPGSTSCFDFDAGNIVNCSTDVWDVQFKTINRGFFILVNGGVSGSGSAAVHQHDTNNESFAIEDADINDAEFSDGSALVSQTFSSDQAQNVFTDDDWYAYALLGGHGIWPNYRVYSVKETATDKVTLFQIINYYNEADVSGHITVRYRELD